MIPSNEGKPKFFEVLFILLEEKYKFFILAKVVKCSYNCHFDAYKIVLISEKWECIQFENLILENFVVNVPCRLSNNSYYINKKWA